MRPLARTSLSASAVILGTIIITRSGLKLRLVSCSRHLAASVVFLAAAREMRRDARIRSKITVGRPS
ncbi:hypothetical protein [Mesorhizobium sp.]|uniref:hypothetical protein n=1 Tax=Mesorhizobium sp. TaxID=1871066 RepID=UPI000AD986D2|nr:hypothetical protein [Mesorhizobium sp.]